MSADEIDWFCSTIDTVGGQRVAMAPTAPLPMGLAAANSLWPLDTHLSVRFLDGNPELHARVLAAAQQWFVPGVRLTVGPAQPGQDAQIRIAFNPNGGSWSYIGRECLGIHPSQPTMNLGWAKLSTPDEQLASVVIHEWGHALGLLHEHNHPGAAIEWNKAAVYADLEGPPNYWSKEKIDLNVFKRYAAADVITTAFDDVSVMIYPVRAAWNMAKKPFRPSSKLSAGDAATIRRLYSTANPMFVAADSPPA
jgi:serralysin